jgi:radial spoke head protein 1
VIHSPQGTYKFKKNNSKYVGDYVQGKKHGQGVFLFPDGSKYEGSWAEDVKSGTGVYTYPNGDTYSGEWVSNVREGNGTYTVAATNTKFEGLWSKDRRSGPGAYVYESHKFSGNFVDDLVCFVASFSLLTAAATRKGAVHLQQR